jgi:hypothetical protein
MPLALKHLVTVQNYFPLYQWTVQSHQGDTWDTFESVDFSLCACPNCDAGSTIREILPCNIEKDPGYGNTTRFPNPGFRNGSAFNEDSCLAAYAISGNTLQMFYNDEHALSLGIGSYVLYNGTRVNATIVESDGTPKCITGYPAVGSINGKYDFSGGPFGNTDVNGLQNYTAPAPASCPGPTSSGCCDPHGCGRPIPPTLFVTDLTLNPSPPYMGDWQNGGTPYTPQTVCGLWKVLTKDWTLGSSPIVAPADNPSSGNIANGVWNLGVGSDPVPAGISNPQSFGAEITWDISSLGLVPAHTYRFQFIVHDGDQNHAGGDIGEGCIIATSACPAGYSGPNCSACDTDPLPGYLQYTWWCSPTGDPAHPYDLLKLPRALTNTYNSSQGFCPNNGQGTAVFSPEGYAVTCDCKLIHVLCNSSCCGEGICDDTVGVCKNCQNGATTPNCGYSDTQCNPPPTPSPPETPPPPGASPPPPSTPAPPPCYNVGLYCSGHGFCVNGSCNCTTINGVSYEGSACQTPSPPPTNVHYCDQYLDCSNCSAAAQQYGISCVWCTAGFGQCTPTTSCPVTDVQTNCSSNGVPAVAVTFIAEPCPDNCGGINNGICVNITCGSTYPPGYKSSYGCLPPPNATYPNGTRAYCHCFNGDNSVNCLGGPSSNIGKIVGLTAGAIAGIVIACIVVVVIISVATQQVVSYALLDSNAFAAAKSNPLFVEPVVESNNQLYENKPRT